VTRDELEEAYVEYLSAKIVADRNLTIRWVRERLWEDAENVDREFLEETLRHNGFKFPKTTWAVDMFDGVVEFQYLCEAVSEDDAEATARAAHPQFDIERVLEVAT
jgi:hypothetical protein